MRNIKVRVAALAMASVLMCSSAGLLVGCKKKSVDDGIHVPDDAIWYDTVKLDLKSPYDDVELSYGMMHDPVYIKDNLYVLVTGEERFDTSLALKDPNFDFNTFISNDNEIQNWKIFGLPDDVTMVEIIDEDEIEDDSFLNNEIKYVENLRIQNAIYTGEILNGKRHGKGTQIWDDGAKYEGNWENDKITKYIGISQLACDSFKELTLS